MASAQVVETSVANDSSSQNSNHPDDLFQSRYVTPGFKPFSYFLKTFTTSKRLSSLFLSNPTASAFSASLVPCTVHFWTVGKSVSFFENLFTFYYFNISLCYSRPLTSVPHSKPFPSFRGFLCLFYYMFPFYSFLFTNPCNFYNSIARYLRMLVL